jgi:hypothetical protein
VSGDPETAKHDRFGMNEHSDMLNPGKEVGVDVDEGRRRRGMGGVGRRLGRRGIGVPLRRRMWRRRRVSRGLLCGRREGVGSEGVRG